MLRGGLTRCLRQALVFLPLPSCHVSFSTCDHNSRILGSQPLISMDPFILIWLSLNFSLPSLLHRTVTFLLTLLHWIITFSLSHCGVHSPLTSRSPPWLWAQGAWCKDPVGVSSGGRRRRLGQGPSAQTGHWLGDTGGMPQKARGPRYSVSKCSWIWWWGWQKGMVGFTGNILGWLQIHPSKKLKTCVFCKNRIIIIAIYIKCWIFLLNYHASLWQLCLLLGMCERTCIVFFDNNSTQLHLGVHRSPCGMVIS